MTSHHRASLVVIVSVIDKQCGLLCSVELQLCDRVGGLSIKTNIYSQKYNLDIDVNCVYMSGNVHYSNFQMMRTRPESQTGLIVVGLVCLTIII